MDDIDLIVEQETVQREILDVLSSSEEGIGSDELYLDGSSVGDRKSVSKAVFELRSSGKIVSKNFGDRKVFVITKEGLDWLKGGTGLKTTEKKQRGRPPKNQPKLSMVSPTSSTDFRCLLSSSGGLLFEQIDLKTNKKNVMELTPHQIVSLWEQLSEIFPRFVKK